MGSESEESESRGVGGQRLGQDVVNLKTSEKFLLVGVTVRRHIELFSFHADFQNAAQPGTSAGHFEKCFLLIRHAHDDHGVERSLSGGFSSGAGASAAPIGVLVGILRGCELSCCRISARTEDDFCSPYAKELKQITDKKRPSNTLLGTLLDYFRHAGKLGITTVIVSCLYKIPAIYNVPVIIARIGSAAAYGIFFCNILFLWLVFVFLVNSIEKSV